MYTVLGFLCKRIRCGSVSSKRTRKIQLFWNSTAKIANSPQFPTQSTKYFQKSFQHPVDKMYYKLIFRILKYSKKSGGFFISHAFNPMKLQSQTIGKRTCSTRKNILEKPPKTRKMHIGSFQSAAFIPVFLLHGLTDSGQLHATDFATSTQKKSS